MSELDLPSAQSSAPAAGARRMSREQRKAVVAGAIGNTVEYIDWGIYGLLAPTFAGHFFPSGNEVTSLLSTLIVFALGFVMRPVGSLVLGPYIDRHGRKKALTLSIFLMSGSAFAIALVPGYSTIGVAAPIILLLARLVQGFSAGGEPGGSMAYLVENAGRGRRGFAGSFQQASTGLGLLIASLISSVLTGVLDKGAMSDWGWRAGFFLGGVLGVIGLWLRTSAPETQAFVRTAQSAGERENVLKILFARHSKPVLFAVGLTIPGAVVNYMWLTYMPGYAHTTTGMDLERALLANTIALAIYVGAIPALGALSDRVGRKPTMLVFGIGFLVLPWPAFHFLSGAFVNLLVVEVLGAVLLAFYSATIATVYSELFPTNVRGTGCALPNAVGVAVFGGTAPYLMTWLHAQGLGGIIWLYPAAAALLGVVLFVLLPETRTAELA